MMFLRNRSLFSIQLCHNLVCLLLILRFPAEKKRSVVWECFCLIVYKEVASLASICNKFFRNQKQKIFLNLYGISLVLCALYLERDP